jgi:hypothetical protein
MKTADDILKELHECENPVTSSSLKTIAITKLKAERDKYRKALEDILDAGVNNTFVIQAIINEAQK